MRRNSHAADLFFLFCLFFLFIFCALTVIILGARVYRSAAEGLEENFSARTALSYLQEKVRSSDRPGAVTLDTLDGCDVLCVDSVEQGKPYRTYIYCLEGSLCELFLPADRDFQPEAGQKLLELSAFSAEKRTDGLLELSCTGAEGRILHGTVYLRSEGGGRIEE